VTNPAFSKEALISAAGTGIDYVVALQRLDAGQIDRDVNIAAAVAVIGQVDNAQSRHVTYPVL
jgi:hypothetical protein